MVGAGKRVSIHDVARAAGSSIATVSYALNNKGEVSAQTRAKILRIAAELGYQPNAAARSLKSGRSRIIGVAVSHRDSPPWQRTYAPYYRSVIAGAAMAAVEHDHAVAAIPVGPRGTFDTAVPIDGLIVVDPGRKDPLLAACVDRRIPVVVDGRPLDRTFAELPVVSADVTDGVRRVVEHFASRGVARATLLTGPQTDSYTLDTDRSFATSTREAGLVGTSRRVGPRESAESAARDLLAQDPRPQAVHCLNETYGHALLAAAADARLSVPDDLLVTISGESASAGASNGVSYLVLDPAEIGARCVGLLIDLLDGKEVESTTVPCELVIAPRLRGREDG